MNTATGFDLFLRSISRGSREFVFEILPWMAVWLLVASPFAWLLARVRLQNHMSQRKTQARETKAEKLETV